MLTCTFCPEFATQEVRWLDDGPPGDGPSGGVPVCDACADDAKFKSAIGEFPVYDI